MPHTIIESVLTGKLDSMLLIKWLNNEAIEDDCIVLSCKRSGFVACFLSYLRNQTDSILLTNSNAVQILQNSTPDKALSSRQKHHRSISEPTSDERDSVSVKTEKSQSPNRDRKRPGRRVKTKLFSEDHKDGNISVSSDESRLSNSIDRMAITSTPLKNSGKVSEYSNRSLSSPLTPQNFSKDGERCDTPRLSHRHSRSHEKSCLGDFIVTATKSSKKKPKMSVSNETEERIELDLSNSEMFPEIGARKSSSLRGEKKRIKPTNIDTSQKSLSLNSFNSECFQQPSSISHEENSAFKHQKFQPKETSNSFEAERNILKQERHKLMEKFNILNTATPQKVSTMPQIKINQKESIEINQSYVKADVTKILLKDKVDLLIDIYDNLLKNNLILSVITEIYFLISIVISKQVEDDYINTESKLKDNNIEYLLKSIHNSSYFAVKSLWNIRTTLEVILDKSSLKTLGENKKVRSFYPELAKFLLNCYCVRCESPTVIAPSRGPAVVCYNMETDSADNFPGTQAFHNFKKQRDMFYEIVRWYQETQSAGGSKSTFRARIKALTSHGVTTANHSHLASLFVAHMLAECLPGNSQESKLSKLQRRLTCPAAPDSHRLPSFTSNEMFYKEFIMHAEHESFRMHLRDALSTEIVTLDATQFAVEDRGSSNNIDISREYLQLAKKLVLLSKFLGFLSALPYSPVPTEIISKNNNVITLNKEHNYVAPKEKVLENGIALRNYSQPTIDIKGLLQNAIDNARLSITIPWVVHYMSMLDYTTLHLSYNQNILKTLLQIYHTKLVVKQENPLKRNTIIYLKSILGWLFDLPHCSETEIVENSVGTDSIDSCDLVDESIFELCPCLRDVNTLLSTCRLSQEQRDVGSFRHITPVSLNVDPQARIRNKEKELQARLEEELLKSQPSSTRRVLEMVIERVTSAAVRELTARELRAASERAREHVARALAHEQLNRTSSGDHATLLASVTSIYSSHLQQLRAVSLESARAPLASRAKAALSALLPTAPAPLQSVACRAARNRLSNWINDHWNTTAVLCKDIESEMKTLMSLNEMRVASVRTPTLLNTSLSSCDESPATVLIHLKEHICLLLDGDACGDIAPILTACAGAASNNNIFCRAPTQRALMQLSVDLCLVYVSKKPKEVTEPFLLKLHAIWNTCCPDRKHYTPENVSVMERREDLSPDLRNFTDDRLPTPISDEETHSETCANGVEGIDPNTRGIDPNSRGIDPNSRGIGPNSRGIDLNTRGIDPNSRAIDPNSRGTDPNSRGIDSNSRGIDPITRGIDPSSRGIDPNSRGTDPNSRGIDPNSRGIDPNSRGIDPNTRGIDKNKRGIDSNVRGIDTKTKGIDSSTQVPICVNTRALCSDTKSVDLISKTEPKSPNCKVNSKPVTPLKRVSLISQPISPKPTSPNTRFHPTIAANAHSLDPNTRKVDSTTKSESKVDQNMTFEESNEHLLEYFDRILCPRNIVMLSASKSQQSDVWEALAIMMVFLLKNDYLCEDSLTEQCLAVYRQDWPQTILEHLSCCMKAVSSRWSRSSTGKFTLFLDFLAEYCGDMDYDITE